jgi:hypothetical protein
MKTVKGSTPSPQDVLQRQNNKEREITTYGRQCFGRQRQNSRATAANAYKHKQRHHPGLPSNNATPINVTMPHSFERASYRCRASGLVRARRLAGATISRPRTVGTSEYRNSRYRQQNVRGGYCPSPHLRIQNRKASDASESHRAHASFTWIGAKVTVPSGGGRGSSPLGMIVLRLATHVGTRSTSGPEPAPCCIA